MKQNLLKLSSKSILLGLFSALIISFMPLLDNEKINLIRCFIFWPIVSVWIFFTFLFSPSVNEKNEIKWSRVSFFTIIIETLIILFYLNLKATWLAVVFMFFYFSYTFWIAILFTRRRMKLFNFLCLCGMALFTSYTIIGFYAVETNFSEEEFFLLIDGIILFIIIFSLFVSEYIIYNKVNFRLSGEIHINKILLKILLSIFIVIFTYWLIINYQKSYYFGDVSIPNKYFIDGNPFQCVSTKPSQLAYDGLSVHTKIIDAIIANPKKSSPEYGMLAISTGLDKWANKFHDSIMFEVNNLEFTQPANSIKVGQYDAALRAYYYPRVVEKFPTLFSPKEQKSIEEWFWKINKRALTIEWVDLLYATPLSYFPQGPYENQENGAGLLSLLEVNKLSDPSLSKLNRNYLYAKNRGWNSRFRNNDDAIIYQLMWITNAYFEHLYYGNVNEDNLRKSFEWLLLQAPPGGGLIQYNHPHSTDLTSIAYLAATLLNDGRFITLAGYNIDRVISQRGYLSAQPGIEYPINLKGQPIEDGSCLIFAESGLPTKVGPIIPDKLVVRSGWESNDSYLLMNLRFDGWHKYKGTGSVILYQNEAPIIKEVVNIEKIWWLPAGRSQERDKRIPRENVNGFVVEKMGLGKVLYYLYGGSYWSQDPPITADITGLDKVEGGVSAGITIDNWNGWDQRRYTIQTDDGITIILDEANGTTKLRTGIYWHIYGSLSDKNNRINIGSYPYQGQIIFLSDHPEKVTVTDSGAVTEMPNLTVLYKIDTSEGELITIILPKNWRGATARKIYKDGNTFIELMKTDGDSNHIRQILISPINKEMEK